MNDGTQYRSGVESPERIWWKKIHKTEKVWVWIAFGWSMVLFAMMPLWHLRGGQNPSGIRHRVEPADFQARVAEFIQDYQVGTDNGFPLVEPPPGSDIYLQGSMWAWMPVLRLQAGAEYVLHMSSIDVNHGFSLYPLNINFQVVPGYDYGLRITPSEPGEFHIICNEFCGVGHHLMVGKVIVVEGEGE
ncbi:MAG: cytochrome C oxidase subunit II [Gemmatimonadetes bacterium]|nr:cytochrome C oxidase subunit II [Gemmatimonadota bacterium]NNM33200.1 cytochrome C oxidase subunit II [Gemmatimonadota bacterium]